MLALVWEGTGGVGYKQLGVDNIYIDNAAPNSCAYKALNSLTFTNWHRSCFDKALGKLVIPQKELL